MADFKEHPLRDTLSEEMHARPHGVIDSPAKVSYLAVVNDETGADADYAHLVELCRLFNTAPPPKSATHFSEDMGRFRLKWERHTEFVTYTFIKEAAFDQPFKDTAIELLPREWLERLPGEVLVASHLALESQDMPERPVPELVGLFDNNTVTGGFVAHQRAMVWTDFIIHGDRFRRYLIRDVGINHRGMARMIQRVLEIETYRSLAMLALPLARDARQRVSEAETKVSEIVSQLTQIEGVEDERELLGRLSMLAAEAESISAGTNYRFSAAGAYFELVKRRLKELKEDRIIGLQPVGEFIERRLIPAMETVENAAERQETLSLRIARASNLLRTRVDVALEGQNRDLLHSMDQRARTQLRLQATVEGLSVVAISYYLLSLISYLAKGAKGMGVMVDPFIVVSVAFPVVVFSVWVGVRRVRRSITRDEKSEN
ncbi:MAG: DUF3422 domain-containing protein [Rhodospirillales bacterium]|nr:DUF3422 domain-containing protein [Rhodospirillales bacterium]